MIQGAHLGARNRGKPWLLREFHRKLNDLGVLRNAVISLMSVSEATNIAAAYRRYAAQPGFTMIAPGFDPRE